MAASKVSILPRSRSASIVRGSQTSKIKTQSKLKLSVTSHDRFVNAQQEIEDKEPNYNLPGVLKIAIRPKTQKVLQLIVGDDVTSEKPWKTINKSALLEHIKNVEDSEFIPIKDVIQKYPEKDMLLGYVVNEQNQIDEFYLCSNVTVKNEVHRLYSERATQLRKILTGKYVKHARAWENFGSDQEIAEMQEDQRFRSLFEVEIESKFPVISEEIKFRNRNADDVRDGFVEVVPYRETYDNAVKVRVHKASQATPVKTAVSVQTVCTFPTNQWTQYGYEYEPPIEVPIIVKKGQAKPKTPLERFLSSDCVKPIYDEMVYNSIMNLYQDDYPDLCPPEYSREDVKRLELKEFMSFADVVMCQDKLVGACSWHHSYSGLVAIAYVDAAKSSILKSKPTRDEVYSSIHGVSPVLLWSASETLHALLELYSPREVRVLEFCPFDENLLIGGLMNGQVILWDLKDRIQFKEAEYLTTAQQKFKTIMKQMTSWYKNIKNDVIVRPACVSNLYLSHRRPISAIAWLPPQQRINRAGKSLAVPNADKNPSYQFISSAEDGCIYIWDLAITPEGDQEIKTARVSKRLHTRLQELNFDMSPFSVLNGVLRPIFKLNMPKSGLVITPITATTFNPMTINYVKIPEETPKDIKTQVKYKTIIPTDVEPFKQVIYVGFANGDVGVAKWEGYDVDAGSTVNTDTCALSLFKRVHDGPILDLLTTSFIGDIVLSIGGKVFAIWQNDFMESPIYVQTKHKFITCCSWSLFRPSCFHLGLADGTIEIYDIIHRMDKATYSQSISGKGLTVLKSHYIPLLTNAMGIGDYRGTFRIFEMPHIFTDSNEELLIVLKTLLDAAKHRLQDFFMWQGAWRQKHIELLNSIAQENQRLKDERRIQLEEEIRLAEQAEQKRIEDERKQLLAESRPQPGEYEKWAQKKFDKMQATRMHNILLKKKRLKREDLVVYLAPLNRIEEEKAKKSIKQEKMLEKKNKLFEDALAISFPEIKEIEGKQKETLIGFPDGPTDATEYQKYLNMYETCEESATEFINDNKYNVTVSWSQVFQNGSQRKRVIDIALKLNKTHRERIKRDSFKPMESIAEQPSNVTGSEAPTDTDADKIAMLKSPGSESVTSIEA